MFLSAILLAAGKGERFGSRISKPLVCLGSMPIIAYSLLTFNNHPFIKEIVVAVNPANKEKIIQLIKKYKIKKVSQVVLGGSRRQDSVYNCLQKASTDAELVLVHDSGRPFVEGKVISSVVYAASKSGAAIVGVPVKATIKVVDRGQGSGVRVKKTLDRERLWEIQTPQVFKKDMLLEAYHKFGKRNVTDDAMLVEKSGRKVSVVLGSYGNIKITTPEDLIIAQAIVKSLSR